MVAFEELLATIDYPLLAALCLFWVYYFIAEYRAIQQRRYLALVGVFLAYTIALSVLSISTGNFAIVPFSDVRMWVRLPAFITAVLGWGYTFTIIREKYHASRSHSIGRNSDY